MKVLIFSLLLTVGMGLGAQDPETLAIGQPAPDFELLGVDGKRYSLDDFRDARVLVVIFSANHCPTAQAYEERMKQLSSDFSSDQMRMVAISSNHPEAVCTEELGYTDLGDSFEEMKIRAEEKAFNFPYLYDGDDQRTAMAYGARATPHVFIFDDQRKLRYSGRIDDMEDPYQVPSQQDARNAINALLEGTPVPVETTRAFGCSMKWKSKMAWRKELDRQWSEKQVSLSVIDEVGLKGVLMNPGEKVRLINVWATWCGPCIIEFPEFVKMQRMYGQRGFEVVSISVDKPSVEGKVLAFLQDKQAAFTNYLVKTEDQSAMINLIDASWQGNLPYTMLLAPGGRVLYRHDGIIDPLEVRKAVIDELGRYFADD